METILLLGNGFDLMHGLPTKYKDFLFVIQNIDEFQKDFEKRIKNDISDDLFDKYYENLNVSISVDKVRCMIHILKTNGWAKYYSKCGAEIQGWIDFENEILPVIEMVDDVCNYDIDTRAASYGKFPNVIRFNSNKSARIAMLWDDLFSEGIGDICLNNGFWEAEYGVLKDKLIDKFKMELENLKKAFTIYLQEFVAKKQIIKKDFIARCHIDKIVSFNYTLLEKEYFKDNDVEICHVHGDIHSENIVLGTDLIKDDSKKYVYFTKVFQRLAMAKQLLYRNYMDKNDRYLVKILGLSLDMNDEDIIKPFIEKADPVEIYYCDINDYESKIVNLLKMFGRDVIERRIAERTIEFREIPNNNE